MVGLHVHLSRYLSILSDPNWTLSTVKIAANVIVRGDMGLTDTGTAQLCCYFLSEVFELDIQHTSNLLISPKLSAVRFSDG